jgi:hypothetical protein
MEEQTKSSHSDPTRMICQGHRIPDPTSAEAGWHGMARAGATHHSLISDHDVQI